MRKRGSSFRTSKAFEILSKMPPLAIWPDRSKPFDPADSPSLKWIASQPDLLQYLFNKARDIGAIRYDKASGCWSGVGTATQEDES